MAQAELNALEQIFARTASSAPGDRTAVASLLRDLDVHTAELAGNMDLLQSRIDALENVKNLVAGEFEHFDHSSNPAMQALARVLKTLGDTCKIGATSKSGMSSNRNRTSGSHTYN